MLQGWQYRDTGRRDVRIDWLRGLAMTCVIINHSKLSSLLTWFSYERFWTVTAAEVFVVLSGIVLGSVYGSKLKRDGWRAVVLGLGRRALTLYISYVAVTFSIGLLGQAGVDVSSLTTLMDGATWTDILLMRAGVWAFAIVGMYVWLVALAVPCLLALPVIGWRPLIGASWILYFWYRVDPHALTAGPFETSFPLLAWQLLFVHGIAIGYHRDTLTALATRIPARAVVAACAATGAFLVFALCNPWTEGPRWLHLSFISADRFAELYADYFSLTALGAGRMLNLAVALPIAYALLTAFWRLARPLGAVFVTLGQQSLGAFVVHVYAILLIANLPVTGGIWLNTLIQLTTVVATAALLNATEGWSLRAAIAAASPGPRLVLGLANQRM